MQLASSRSTRDPRLPLAIYGLALAAGLTVLVMWWMPDWWSSFNRAGGLADAVRASEHGQPLLIAETPSGVFYSVGTGDDLGIYVLGPLLAGLTGITDPFVLSRLLMLTFFVPIVAISPVLFHQITGSVVAALVAPIGIVVGVRLFGESPYWIVAWAVLGLIPVLLWVEARWTPAACGILGLAVLLAGVAATLRSVAGTSVLLAVLIVVLTRAPWGIAPRVAAAALAVGLYVLVSSVTISALERHRDRESPPAAVVPDALNSHVFWHNAYIGMGYLPNDYDLWWNDTVALRDARRVDPHVEYLTNRYERLMRQLTLDLVKKDPPFALRVFSEKLLVGIGEAAPYLVFLLLLLPSGIRSEGALFRRLLLATAPAALLGLLSGIVGLPSGGYLYGWLAALWLICIACVSLGIARTVEGGFPHRGSVLTKRGSVLRGLSELSPRRLILGAGVAATLVVTALLGDSFQDRAIDWSNEHGGVNVIVTSP